MDAWGMMFFEDEGSFGEVYRARKGDKLLAVKFFHKNKSKSHPERIKREFDLVSSLRHKSILSYISWHENSSIVMEYVDGMSIREELTHKTPTVDYIFCMVKDVSNALSYLHSRDVAHQDISEGNVIYDGETFKLIDYDSMVELKNVDDWDSNVGTLFYTFPIAQNVTYAEKVGKEPNLLKSHDVWAFGVLILQLVCDYDEYENTIDKLVQIYKTKYVSKTPHILQDIIEGCLVFNPYKRWSAEDVCDVIHCC